MKMSKITKYKITGCIFQGLIILFFSACGGSSDSSVTESDFNVDSFVINQVLDVEPLTEVISNTVTVLGINEPVSLSVSGCSYSLNSSAYQTNSAMVSQSDTINFKLIASSQVDTTVTCDITVSQFSTQFLVTTRGELVTIEVFVQSNSAEDIALTPGNLFVHDEIGENQTAIEISADKIVIPESSQGVSYTLYADTDRYGYQYHQLFTVYGARSAQIHRIRPKESGYFYDDCKSVSLVKNSTEPAVNSFGIYTASKCASTIGISAFSTPTSLTLDIANLARDDLDLIYFTRDSENNFLDYKLFSSSDFHDGDEILADNLVFDSNFITVSIVTDIDLEGSLQIFGVLEDKNLGLLLGQHDLALGLNSSLVNIADVNYNEYRLSYSFSKASQFYWYNKVVNEIPAIDDSLPTLDFLISADLIDNQMSWELDSGKMPSSITVWLEKSIDDVKYRWEIQAQDTGSITIPTIPSLNTQKFLENASVIVFLRSLDETTLLNESVYAFGRLDCQNDVCSLNMSLD